MRVITGTARGRKLITLEGNDVRPTTDMVKEAIFSIIQFDVPGSVFLDLFSGSGQMGIEALSRGAKFGYFVDNSKKSVDVTTENLKNVGFDSVSKCYLMDAKSFLSATNNTFDIALLDPPYSKGILQEVLPLLTKKMSDRGIILCEHPAKEEMPDEVENFYAKKTYRYGKIEVTLYKVKED